KFEMVGMNMLNVISIMLLSSVILGLVYYPDLYAKSSNTVKFFLGAVLGVSLFSSIIILLHQMVS
ncbi:hypothetical protein RFF58_10685, partial [Streptococcus ruminantium]|nr:hypothetical protein [Streptococcus ruminantium]